LIEVDASRPPLILLHHCHWETFCRPAQYQYPRERERGVVFSYSV